MTAAASIAPAAAGPPLVRHIVAALEASERRAEPYRHWLLEQVLPEPTAADILGLPFAAPAIGDTLGRRETNNDSRIFFSPGNRARLPVIGALADAFQGPAVVGALGHLCGIDLGGTSLRIEYCQDREGFWLEPHTDIRVKKITLLVYLSRHPEAEGWGTDIYDGELRRVGRASGAFNRGLIFVPAADTWHGFERRPIPGVRRSLIVNYVGPEWRARDELAFPETPVA